MSWRRANQSEADGGNRLVGWTARFMLGVALLVSPMSRAADVDDLLRDIARQERQVRKLSKKSPSKASDAVERLHEMKVAAGRALAGEGRRALTVLFDLDLAHRHLERGRELDVDVPALDGLEIEIADVKGEVASRHADGVVTFTTLDVVGSPSDRWTELFDEYRYLVQYDELDKEIGKYHRRIGKIAFPLLVARGDREMQAHAYVDAVGSYGRAREIKPRDRELAVKLQTATDFKMADELAEQARGLLVSDHREYGEAIALYDRALDLHPDYAPLLEGRQEARRVGVEVLMADAKGQFEGRKFFAALILLEEAGALGASHERTLTALAELDRDYRRVAADGLIARGDGYGGAGFQGQAYVEYTLATLISVGGLASIKAEEAVSLAREHVRYSLRVDTPSPGTVTNMGEVHNLFSSELASRLSRSKTPEAHETTLLFGVNGEADGVFGGSFSAFGVERTESATQRTKSYVVDRYPVPNPDYDEATEREAEAREHLEREESALQKDRDAAAAKRERCMKNPPRVADPLATGGCTGSGPEVCDCYGENYSTVEVERASSALEDAVRNREQTPTEVIREDRADHTWDVAWHHAAPTASLDMRIVVELTDKTHRSRAAYNNSHKDYTVSQQVVGVDNEVLEEEHQAVLPNDLELRRDMLDSLLEQAEKFVLEHVTRHGERWKDAYQQRPAEWQLVHGSEYLVLALLSQPSLSEETADWAAKQLQQATGLDWEGKRAVLSQIPPLSGERRYRR